MIGYKCVYNSAYQGTRPLEKKQTISGSTHYFKKYILFNFFLNLRSQLQHVTF